MVDQDFCSFTQQAVAPDSLVQFGHDPCSLGDLRADLGVEIKMCVFQRLPFGKLTKITVCSFVFRSFPVVLYSNHTETIIKYFVTNRTNHKTQSRSGHLVY